MDDLLFIEGTSAVGQDPVFGQGVTELCVELVGQAGGDALPDDNHHHDGGRRTCVSSPFPDQHQQLLILTASPDHLPNTQ